MITIKKLKEELNKFSDDDLCYAYEGEVVGLIIERAGERLKSQGVIFCSEGNDDDNKETTHYGMKEQNKIQGFNSFTGKTIDFAFPVDKSEYLYTKEDLKEAWIHGCIRMPEELKHLNNFDDWFENFKKIKNVNKKNF